MTDAIQKEDLSIHYLGILCSRAKIDLEQMRHDTDGVDVILKKRLQMDNDLLFDAEVHFQLKATSSKKLYSENDKTISYSLKVKNYNDMTVKSAVPLYIVLFILPENREEWLLWSEEQLLVKGRMYYYKCGDFEEASDNKSTIQIHIDKKNCVNETTLTELLRHEAEEVMGI